MQAPVAVSGFFSPRVENKTSNELIAFSILHLAPVKRVLTEINISTKFIRKILVVTLYNELLRQICDWPKAIRRYMQVSGFIPRSF